MSQALSVTITQPTVGAAAVALILAVIGGFVGAAIGVLVGYGDDTSKIAEAGRAAFIPLIVVGVIAGGWLGWYLMH